ncbi:MAG: hypothetical protein ACT4QF_05070 [Sporichthyaceae bacterium]
MADCSFYDLGCKTRSSLTGAVTGVVESAFEKMCQAFADAGAAVLREVAGAFLATSTINLGNAGIDRVLVVTTSIGMGLAVLLLLFQVVRTGLTMRGEHLAQGITGVLKAALATGTVLAVATALLAAADAMSSSIMEATFGSTEEFSERFATAVTFAGIGQGNPAAPVALLLVFGLLAVFVGAILFAEMLFRHVAVVAIVATAPIGASGLVAAGTTGWWRKLVVAGLQLIFLKPLIVLVFAIGFGVAGSSKDVLGVLAGLVTLLIAAFAWPILARFCTWTSAHVADAGGATAFVGGYLGAEASRLPRRVMSAQANGSSFDSDRATMARNSAAIDGAFGAPGALAGSGAASGAAAAASGGVTAGLAVAGRTATAVKDRIEEGVGEAADRGGLDRPSHGPPSSDGPSPTLPQPRPDRSNGDPQ